MASQKRPAKNASPVGLLLFGLIFLVVGLAVGTFMLRPLWLARAARGWIPVPCRITASELKVNHDSDSTTYQATAAYEYEFEGRTYRGTRVSFHSGSDNIGDFHETVAARLAACRESGRPFEGYVNPANPFEAVLVREVRKEMIGFGLVFGLVFSGAGSGVMFAGVRAARQRRSLVQGKAQTPEAPWTWRREWAAGVIPATQGAEAAGLAVGAVLWNLLVSVFLVAVLSDRGVPKFVLVLLAVFVLAGIGLLTAAVKAFLRWRRFRGTCFRMSPVPGVLGGRLSGAVQVPVKLAAAGGFRLKLDCFERVVQGSGKHRRTVEVSLWSAEQEVHQDVLAQVPGQTAIPVVFDLPADLPESSPEPGGPLVWRLEARAEVPGVDFLARFEVPVFAGRETRRTDIFD